MRALTIASGVAVLLTALHLVHAIHHFMVFSAIRSSGFWAATAFAAVVDLLTFFGGFQLLLRGR